MSTITTFGDVDTRSLEQLKRCMEAGDAAFGVLCADHHPGYSQPIGGGIAYEGYVSPSTARSPKRLPSASARKPDAVLWPKPREPKWTPIQTMPSSSTIRLT